MATTLKETVNHALAVLPTQEEIRRRIAENLQDRQVLRQMLKLAERQRQATAVSKADARHVD